MGISVGVSLLHNTIVSVSVSVSVNTPQYPPHKFMYFIRI